MGACRRLICIAPKEKAPAPKRPGAMSIFSPEKEAEFFHQSADGSRAKRSVIARQRGAVFRQPKNDAVNGLAEHCLIRNVQTGLCSKFVR
jgi:hypothetical protein